MTSVVRGVASAVRGPGGGPAGRSITPVRMVALR